MASRMLILSSLAVLAGCVANDDPASQERQAERCDDTRIAWVGNDPANTYDNANLDGARAVAAAGHADVSPFYGEFDPSLQLSLCEQAIDDGYDAIVVIPTDSVGIEACVQRAFHAHVPVVATDLPIGPDLTTVEPQVRGQVGAVLVPAADWGSDLTDLVRDLCAARPSCNVAYIAGSFDVAFDQIALDDLDALAASDPSVAIVDREEAFYDQGLAYQAAQTILADHPDVDVIVGAGDQMTEGAEQAIADADLPAGSIQLVGAGAGAYGVQAVRDGRWYATFVSLPGDEGTIGTQIVLRAAEHRHVADPGVNPVTAHGWPPFFTAADQAQFADFVPQWPGS